MANRIKGHSNDLELRRLLANAIGITQQLDERPFARRPQCCPCCRGTEMVKRGFDSHRRQRYKCKACGATFTRSSATAAGSSKVAPDTWLAFLECFLEGCTLRVAASRCGVSLKTAHYMKQRIIRVLPHEGDGCIG